MNPLASAIMKRIQIIGETLHKTLVVKVFVYGNFICLRSSSRSSFHSIRYSSTKMN